MVREAEVLSRRLTWISTLAFEYEKGAENMETGTVERILSKLVLFEIASSDHTRAIAPERSRLEAEMARAYLVRSDHQMNSISRDLLQGSDVRFLPCEYDHRPERLLPQQAVDT